MTIYNINLGIGWASSGVEYAQIYRAKLLRSVGLEAKFIFISALKTLRLSGFISILQMSKLHRRPIR